MFKPFHDVVSNVSQTIKTHAKELDRPVIGVMPAYFPMEIIWAAGGYPVQLWGNRLTPEKADTYLQSYCCSVARSILELELTGGADIVKAYAFTSLCDTLINLREIYRRIFDKPTLELSIPITGTKAARHTYLRSVVRNVTEGVEAITGNAITPPSLAEAAKLFGRMRMQQKELYQLRRRRPGVVSNHDFYNVIKAGFFLPPRAYSQMLQMLLEALDGHPYSESKRPRILLSGLVFDPIAIYKIFDEVGIDIVDDDFACGWRTAAKDDLQVENLVEGVTDYLFNPAPCCCIYNPDKDRHAYLIEKVKASGAEGVIFWYIKFCEPDAFDRPQLEERLRNEGVAATTIEIELSMRNFHAIKTRVEAFGEMIKG